MDEENTQKTEQGKEGYLMEHLFSVATDGVSQFSL